MDQRLRSLDEMAMNAGMLPGFEIRRKVFQEQPMNGAARQCQSPSEGHGVAGGSCHAEQHSSTEHVSPEAPANLQGRGAGRGRGRDSGWGRGRGGRGAHGSSVDVGTSRTLPAFPGAVPVPAVPVYPEGSVHRQQPLSTASNMPGHIWQGALQHSMNPIPWSSNGGLSRCPGPVSLLLCRPLFSIRHGGTRCILHSYSPSRPMYHQRRPESNTSFLSSRIGLRPVLILLLIL